MATLKPALDLDALQRDMERILDLQGQQRFDALHELQAKYDLSEVKIVSHYRGSETISVYQSGNVLPIIHTTTLIELPTGYLGKP